MPERILSDKEETLLAEERRILSSLRVLFERIELEEEDASTFDGSIHQLDELFLLVIAGEFNAGKSAFINALLEGSVLEEGVTPTTQRVTLLQYGEQESREAKSAAFEVVSAPVALLKQVGIVDTPGTNAILREHEAITREFIPRSDIVLFVTSADRPFTESERGFLEGVRDWGKKVTIVVNKIDILDRHEDIEEVVRFVTENAEKLLGTEAPVFPISARQAQKGKAEGDEDILRQSRFGELENFLRQRLDDRERVRLKLLNPIGVGEALAKKYSEVVQAELGLLSDDLRMLDEIESQLALYEEDQNRDFAYRLSDIDNALLDFESRGAEYFEETLRLARVFDLVNKAKVKADFERRVVGDLPREVEKRVEAVIDWMVESENRQWKEVMEHLEKRRSAQEERMVGRIPPTFDQDRKRLLDTVGAAAKRAVDGFDHDRESTRLADSVQTAVASTALLEVGAVGLGTLVATIATTTAADVTGILAASALSVVGLLVLPAKKRRAKRELNRRVAEVREKLMTSLRQHFVQEMKGSVARIQEAIAPYTRFVRAEKDRLTKARDELERSLQELGRLRAQIEKL